MSLSRLNFSGPGSVGLGGSNNMGQGYNPYQAMGAAGGAIGAGLGQMFAPWNNPSTGAMDTLGQIPGAVSPYLDPYNQAGQRQLPGLENQFGQMMNDPGGRLNQIGQGYHQSPGFQFALQQALQGGNHAAARGGMAGSPQHEQQNMELATQLGNQDYNNWMHNAMEMHGMGLQGAQNLAGQGLTAGTSLSDQISQALAQQANAQYKSANAENEHEGGAFGSLLGGLGTMAGTLFGGPAGGAAGGFLGKLFGG